MFVAFSKFLKLNKIKKFDHDIDYNLKVILLDNSEISLKININEKVIILFDKICFNLHIELKDCFGLKFINDDCTTKWLHLSKSYSSQILEYPCSIYFGVKFYPVDPCKINSEYSRYHIFLQLKRDIYEGKIVLSNDLAILLSAYAVQSELGDFDPIDHQPGYVSEFNFLTNQHPDFEYKVEERHKMLRGRTSVKCEFQYLDRVKWLEFYGVQLFPVLGEDKKSYFFGLSPLGVLIFKQENKIGSYFWCRIIKFTTKSKMLYVKIRERQGNEKILLFELSTKDEAKYLCRLCSDHQEFYRSSGVTYMPQEHRPGKLLSFGSRYFQKDKKKFETQSQIFKRQQSGNASQPESYSTSALNPYSRMNHKQDDELSIRTSKSSFHHPDQPESANSPLSMRSEHVCRHHHHRRRNDRNAVTAAETTTGFSSASEFVNGERSCKFGKKKHHRLRSRSPINFAPKELAQHFRYVDPKEEGLSDDCLQEIPYTAVKTETVKPRVQFSPRTKNRIEQSRKLALCKPLAELDNRMPMPDGEAPPPYASSPNQYHQDSNGNYVTNQNYGKLFVPSNRNLVQIHDIVAKNINNNLENYLKSNQADNNTSGLFIDDENIRDLFITTNQNSENGIRNEKSTLINLPIAKPIIIKSPSIIQPLKVMTAPILKTKSLSKVQMACGQSKQLEEGDDNANVPVGD